MLKKILLALILGLGFVSKAQTTLNNTVNISSANKIIEDKFSVRMLPGFSVKAITTNIFFDAKINSNISLSQTLYTSPAIDTTYSFNKSENYVFSRTYLEPVNTSQKYAKQIQSIQFSDGLGRLKQTVSIKSTPSGKDMVKYIPYDSLGRRSENWLPVPLQTANGNIHNNIKSEIENYYSTDPEININDTFPYSMTIFDNSPLNRVVEVTNPGSEWNQTTGKTKKYDYDINIENEVKKYSQATSWSDLGKYYYSTVTLSNQNYNKGDLYKIIIKDEDNNETNIFKNDLGQTILIRKFEGSNKIDTYYIYNDFGQLSMIVPPKASIKTTFDDTVINKLCYIYRYDEFGRVIEKRLPDKGKGSSDKGWTYLIYDKQDRVVATQDPKLKSENKWLYTKYDKFGRVLFTGITTGDSRIVEQANVETFGLNNEKKDFAQGFDYNQTKIYYTKNSYPSSVGKILNVIYYDEYPPNSPVVNSVQGVNVISSMPISSTSNPDSSVSTKGLVTATLTNNIEEDAFTKNLVYYDIKGRIVASYTENYKGGYTKVENKLKFSGVPEEVYTTHKRDNNVSSIIVSIKDTFTYDHQERLVEHKQKIGNADEVTVNNIKYNELGQVQYKNIDVKAGNPLQAVKQQYNIRGWLTKINDPKNLLQSLFALELKYTNPNTSNSVIGAEAKYNGNISQMDYISANDAILRRYTYQYDNLDRLKQARYWDSQNLDRDEYQEKFSYDENGNITSLFRTGEFFGTAAIVYDNLKYYYDDNDNKLTKIEELGTGKLQDGYPLAQYTMGLPYEYDDNGNMTKQPDKGITNIAYNFLDLPSKVTINNASTGGVNKDVDYLYSADGTKLKKVYNGKTIDYLDGFQYENGVLQLVPNEEGYYDFVNSKYIYNYTDQVGNIRLSYYRGTNNEAVIYNERNYYPFGLEHKKYGYKTASSYNYQFGDKEYQAETDWLDFGARNYMADIGRWGSSDPLAEQRADLSPYRFAYNNPISFTDPDGMSEDGGGDWDEENDNNIDSGKGDRFLRFEWTENARNNEQGVNIFEKPILIALDIINGDFRISSDIKGGGDASFANDFRGGEDSNSYEKSESNADCGCCPPKSSSVPINNYRQYSGHPIGGGMQSVNLLAVPYMLLEAFLAKGMSETGLMEEGEAYETAKLVVFLSAFWSPKGSTLPGIAGKGYGKIIRIDVKNLPKSVTNDIIEILAGRGKPIIRNGVQETVRNNKNWQGGLEWKINDIAGTGINGTRIIQHPSGKWGLIINHNYKQIIEIPISSQLK